MSGYYLSIRINIDSLISQVDMLIDKDRIVFRVHKDKTLRFIVVSSALGAGH